MPAAATTISDLWSQFQTCYRDEFLKRFKYPFLIAINRVGAPDGECNEPTVVHTTNVSNDLGVGDESVVYSLEPYQTRRDTKKRVYIGRARRNDIILKTRAVSKRHAYLDLSETTEEPILVDTGSKNGTKLNNEPLEAHIAYRVSEGDTVVFGNDMEFIYCTPFGLYHFMRLRGKGV